MFTIIQFTENFIVALVSSSLAAILCKYIHVFKGEKNDPQQLSFKSDIHIKYDCCIFELNEKFSQRLEK